MEINPFFETTGLALFDDAEGRQILSGQGYSQVGGHVSKMEVEYPVMKVCEKAEGLKVVDPSWRRGAFLFLQVFQVCMTNYIHNSIDGTGKKFLLDIPLI